MNNAFYGWFDDASQKTPTSDVPIGNPCLYCGVPTKEDDIRTYNIMYVEGYAKRSYFYQVHRTCAIKWSDISMDNFIFDMIKRNGD